MKKLMKCIFGCGCGVILLLASMDARAYTLSPTWTNTGLYLQATLGTIPGSYTNLTKYHARMENVSGANSASSDWSIGLLPITESWGPEGKMSSIGQVINTDMSATLASGSATLGNMAFILQGFDISADSSPPVTTPQVTLTVTWGGEVNMNLASGQIALQETHDGMAFTNVIPVSSIDFTKPGNQQTFQGILPELSDAYFLTLNLRDQALWSGPGEYDTNMWISVTMDVTEAVAPLPPPPAPVPIPGTLALLGSGLAVMLGNRRKLKNQT